MSPEQANSLDAITARTDRERTLRRKADEALAKGIVTPAEHAFYLKEELGISEKEPPVSTDPAHAYAKQAPSLDESLAKKRKSVMVKALTTFLLIAGVLASLWLLVPSQGGLTGLVTFSPTQEQNLDLVFSQDGNVTLNLTNISGLAASGELVNGSGELWLVADGVRHLIWHGTAIAPQYSVSTDKESYALNGTVNVTVSPPGTEYTLWLTDADGGKTLVQDGFVATVPGAYALDALINHSGNITLASVTFTVRNDTNASGDVIRVPKQASLPFTDACEESCSFNATNDAALSLDIVTDGELRLSTLTVQKPRTNSAPVLERELLDLSMDVGTSTEYDLDTYFTDPDGDLLTYDYMNIPGLDFTVNGSNLTITAMKPGVHQALVYASDLAALAQSNVFTITVYGIQPVSNGTNVTPSGDGNTTIPNATLTNITTNITMNITTNITTNRTGNITLPPDIAVLGGCENKNPNLRPASCFEGLENLAYAEVVAPLRNKQLQEVGRITRFGNLIIRGLLRERSTAEPGPKDFTIGYTRSTDFTEERVVTAWINSETGDLHLRGQLFQERSNLVPPQFNTYIIQNRNGLVLGYFDERTGDLYLKGNIVQLGDI